MAMARAICRCSECGAEFEVRVARSNRREADSFEKWAAEHITICNECDKKARDAAHAAENEKATKVAEENGYPKITGTEKQIAWANTIREKALATLKEVFLDPERIARRPLSAFEYEALSGILLDQTAASFWIDNRSSVDYGYGLIEMARMADNVRYTACIETINAIREGNASVEVALKSLRGVTKPEEEDEQPAEIRPEAVPENRKHEGSADIHFDGVRVVASYARDETFRQIVKAMQFTWSDCWTCKPGEMNGRAEDIAAELGSRLLNSGFAVRFDDQQTLDRAVSGDYTPMCHRWIKSDDTGFGILWDKDNLYYAAKSLPGARYDRGIVKVPDRSWQAVVDFAVRYGFRFTGKAKEKMDTLSGSVQPVVPSRAKTPEYNEKNVLESSREIIEDLKD